MKHTPAPWKWFEQGEANQYCLLTNRDNRWILSFTQNGELSIEQQRANADRIVHCVNATEGIENVEEVIALFKEFKDQLENGVPISISPKSSYGRIIKSINIKTSKP